MVLGYIEDLEKIKRLFANLKFLVNIFYLFMSRFIDRVLESELFNEDFSSEARVLSVEGDKISLQVDLPVLKGSPSKGVTGISEGETRMDIYLGQTPKLVLIHDGEAHPNRIVLDEGSRKSLLGVVEKADKVEVVYSMESPRIRSIKGNGEFRFQYGSVGAPPPEPPKPVVKEEATHKPTKKPYSKPPINSIDLKNKTITKEDFQKVSGKGERTVYQYFWMKQMETPTFNDLETYLARMKATDEEKRQAGERFANFILDYIEQHGKDGIPTVDCEEVGGKEPAGSSGETNEDTIGFEEMKTLLDVTSNSTLQYHLKKGDIPRESKGRYNRPKFMEYLGTRSDINLDVEQLPLEILLAPLARFLRSDVGNLRTAITGYRGVQLDDGHIGREGFEIFMVKAIGSQARKKAENALLGIGYGIDRVAQIFAKYTD